MGGAGCAVRAIDAGKALAAGDKLTVSSSGGECSIVAGRFSGAEMLALSMPIDINSADARDLEALPSIGPALAARIVEHRTTNGPFQSINDLFFVKGVGPETLKKIAQKVTVGR
ncbi:MAG: helix-hairpin-helix domain-containing protein [Deltaproteobacteria bacterium]|nr:helix-hairpin-helix domain-containing protein [Deltaproteobacteria bacterium]